ncbi:uncharacterized protein LOC144077534 isoform X2 [Stigmatopora argus]
MGVAYLQGSCTNEAHPLCLVFSNSHVHADGRVARQLAWLNQDAVLPVCPRTLKPLRLQVHVQVIFPGCPLEDDAASLNSVHVQVIFPGCPLEDDASCMMWRL